MTTEKDGSNALTAVIRWSARVLGVVTASFLLLMFFGYFLEGRAPSPGSLTPFAAFGLVLLGIYTVAMFLALRWEHGGALVGAIVLAGFFAIVFVGLMPGNVTGGFSTSGVLNPVFLALWLPVLLYLACWIVDTRRAP
jgi:hypothetical protein